MGTNDIKIATSHFLDPENMGLFKNIVDTMQNGVLLVDMDQTVIYCNDRFCKISGFSREDLLGNNARTMLLNEKAQEFMELQMLKRSEGASSTYEIPLRQKNGDFLWVEVSASPIKNSDGEVVGSVGVHTDISEKQLYLEQIQNSLEEKKVMLKEIHHRVKNNIQIISSLLSLQSKSIDADEQVINLFRDSQNRIRSMALVHEILYGSENLKFVDCREYMRSLMHYLADSLSTAQRGLAIEQDVEGVSLNLDRAIPCGLIINELVSNAIKYAFPANSEVGKITVSLRPDKANNYVLKVSDTGVGLPVQFDPKEAESLGLQLVDALVDQLDGSLHYFSNDGAHFVVRFPQED